MSELETLIKGELDWHNKINRNFELLKDVIPNSVDNIHGTSFGGIVERYTLDGTTDESIKKDGCFLNGVKSQNYMPIITKTDNIVKFSIYFDASNIVSDSTYNIPLIKFPESCFTYYGGKYTIYQFEKTSNPFNIKLVNTSLAVIGSYGYEEDQRLKGNICLETYDSNFMKCEYNYVYGVFPITIM